MNDKDKKPGNPWTKSLLIWVGILFALVLFVQMIGGGARSTAGQAMAYSEFVRQVDEGNVRSVIMATAPPGTPRSAASSRRRGFPHRRTGRRERRRQDDSEGCRGPGQGRGNRQHLALHALQSLPFLLILGISFFVMRQMQKNAGSARWASARAAPAC
jgi:cell division protease FtsH